MTQPFHLPDRIRAIDSHTCGEPTRTIVQQIPEFNAPTLVEQRDLFRQHFDDLRTATLLEPRGNDVLVGALLCPAKSDHAVAGVIFFNNTGYLGMCGHGMIGFAVTLAYLGQISSGTHCIETPVGDVVVQLLDDSRVAIQNVASYRHLTDVTVQTKNFGSVTGDIAWGGNWFFITEQTPVPLQLCHERMLTDYTTEIRQAIEAAGITGANNGVIDHIEISGSASSETADGRNFVLCPGLAYDRSPCGTGTSAKIACLAADQKLKPGDTWRQESIVGSVFEATYIVDDAAEPFANGNPIVRPTIVGDAYITADAELIFQRNDPFVKGIQI